MSFPNDDLPKTCHFDAYRRGNFDDLRKVNLKFSTTVQHVIISNLSPPLSSFELGLALKSLPRVTKLTFKQCLLEDVGPICMALSADKNALASLEFIHCTLSHYAAESICVVLHANVIGLLAFDHCVLSSYDRRIIGKGIKGNKSLKSFRLIAEKKCDVLLSCVKFVLERNNNQGGLKELALTLPGIDVTLFAAVETFKSLTSLQLDKTLIDLKSMEAICFFCFCIPSLKHLHLGTCVIDDSAMEFLVRMLSSRNIIHSLTLGRIYAPCILAPGVSCGNMKVQKLDISGAGDDFGLVQTLNEVAENRYIQCLHLDELSASCFGSVEPFCEGLLRQNKSPKELVISTIVGKRQMSQIVDAFQQNTSCSILTLLKLQKASLLRFVNGLADMRGLRMLTIGSPESEVTYTKDVVAALDASLKENTTLSKLVIHGVFLDDEDGDTQRVLTSIRYSVAINRVGRHSLLTAPIPVGIWALVLARSSYEADGIYFVLTEKPEIVTPSRKRKEREEY